MTVKISDVFKVGKVPQNAEATLKLPHPANKKKRVRFIRQETGTFFNVGDFLKPYKNPSYEIAIKVCLPKDNRNLSQIWMAQKAWEAMAEVIKKGHSKSTLEAEIFRGVSDGTLFPYDCIKEVKKEEPPKNESE
jgi:hypothetical protein